MSLKIRPYNPELDGMAVRKLYEQREKRLNPQNPLNFAAVVAEDESGKVVGYMVLRPFVATHTVVDDKSGSRSERFNMIMEMSKELATRAHASGFAEAVYECPPPYEKMGDKIAELYEGVEKNESPTYTVHLERFLKNWEGN